MDIYTVVKQEGRYLVGELEKLRRKRSASDVVVKCTRISNDTIQRFRKAFLLDCGIADVFTKAQQYYITLDKNTISLTLVYNVCHIIYRLREERDWKFVELEIIDIALCSEIVPNKSIAAGRAEITAIQILANCAITCGLHNAFPAHSDTFLADIFETIAQADELKKAEFGLDAKITSLILKMA